LTIHDVLKAFEQMKHNFDANGTLEAEFQGIRLTGEFADLSIPERGIEGGKIVVTR
jgi:hypothetical protein